MIYFCCDELPAQRSAPAAPLNGIDYLEVLDHEIEPAIRPIGSTNSSFISSTTWHRRARCSRTFASKAASASGIIVVTMSPVDGHRCRTAECRGRSVRRFFASTRCAWCRTRRTWRRPTSIDPLFAAVDFSFKVECPSDFDCQPQLRLSGRPRRRARDRLSGQGYASFRRLMLDRMAVLMPQWRERNPADLGVALVELLAYVGDI